MYHIKYNLVVSGRYIMNQKEKRKTTYPTISYELYLQSLGGGE